MTRVHAFGDDALGDHDAVGLVEAMRAGAVSAAELVEAAVARTERVNPDLNALAHLGYRAARARAHQPGTAYLAGVPSFLKDNVDVAGMPTQHGSDAFRSPAKKADGPFASLYLATGLVPLGKTQLSEFGFSAAAEHPRLGPVRNPWHVEHTAGASSSGSAALVAAGAVPLAHANDGGGSIRIPAAVNGLVGLKPTRDRLPQDLMMRTMPVRIVADGVVSRSVRDTAVFLREAEKIRRNLRLPPIGDVTRPSKRRLRVAVITQSPVSPTATHVEEQTLATARLLEELGHQVSLTQSPMSRAFADDFLVFWSMLSLTMLRTGRMSFGPTWDRTKVDNLTLGLERHCLRNMHRYPAAVRRLRRSASVSEAFYADYDVMLTPTLAHETPRIGHLDPMNDFETTMGRLLEWVAFTPYQNATGEPAVSLPLGVGADGLPLGMMVGAPAGHEATLLGLAYELEAAAPWRRIQDA